MGHATALLISSQPADKARVANALAAIRGQPYRLEVASTLAEGLTRIKHGRDDAVLLDLNLPDSAGLTTFLRAQPKATHIPIIVLVSEGEEDIGPDAVSRTGFNFRSVARRWIIHTSIHSAGATSSPRKSKS